MDVKSWMWTFVRMVNGFNRWLFLQKPLYWVFRGVANPPLRNMGGPIYENS